MGSRNWNFSVKSLRSSAVFGGRLKRPTPCRIRSATGRDRVCGLCETSEKCVKFCILGGIRPSHSLISAYAELERKKHIKKHLFPSWHHFQIGFLCRPHHTRFMVTPRSVCPIVVRLLCRCFSISDFKVKYLSFVERLLSSRGTVPYPTTSLHPVSVLILHPREIQLIIMWSHTVRQCKPNNRNQSRYKASEMLAYRVREHNKTG